MFLNITSSWPLFCIVFGGMLFLKFIKSLQSAQFYTKDVVLRKFSIMELQLPSTSLELVNLIKGLYSLPAAASATTVKTLRAQLYLDFIFMPFAYGSVMLLCMQMSHKMSLHFGTNIFMILAFIQLLAWLCDIIENIYLLQKINPEVAPSSPGVHKAYLTMECLKWGISLISTISAVAAIFYFWLTGHYDPASLHYLVIIILEIVVFILLLKLFYRKKEVQL